MRTIVWAAALLVCGAGHAFETLNSIKASGRIAIGLHQADATLEDRVRAQAFAVSLGVGAVFTDYSDYAALLAALEAGEVDLVATPMDRARPVKPFLAFSPPVDFRNLDVIGRIGPVAVVYQSDAWYRVLSEREAGRTLELRILPATTPESGVAEALRRGHELSAIAYQVTGLDRSGPSPRRLLARVARSWVLRAEDRVLRFKADQFLHRHVLLADAREHGARLPSHVVRTLLNEGHISRYDAAARYYGRHFGFDWRLVLAIIHSESRFDPDARSRSGAQGLMQLKPIAVEQVGLTTIDSATDNILAGVRYLQWVRDRFEEELDIRDRTWFSLAAYNAGLSHIREARALAPSLGLDPGRWFDHVELALAAYADQGGLSPGKRREVMAYVAGVRRQFALYVRLTEGPEGFSPSSGAAAAAAAP